MGCARPEPLALSMNGWYASGLPVPPSFGSALPRPVATLQRKRGTLWPHGIERGGESGKRRKHKKTRQQGSRLPTCRTVSSPTWRVSFWEPLTGRRYKTHTSSQNAPGACHIVNVYFCTISINADLSFETRLSGNGRRACLFSNMHKTRKRKKKKEKERKEKDTEEK